MSKASTESVTPTAISRAPQYTQPFTFVPVNLDSQEEVDELIRQRKICGWSYATKIIDQWRQSTREGAKELFWITVPTTRTSAATEKPAVYTDSTSDVGEASEGTNDTFRAGHIALTAVCDPPDPELARLDRTVLALNDFFVLPEHRALGLGRACVAEIEKRALEYPQCKTLALCTWSRRYHEDAGPDWGGRAAAVGFVMKPGMSNEDWYARLGYVKFKDEPRFPIDARPDLAVAVFMRKKLR